MGGPISMVTWKFYNPEQGLADWNSALRQFQGISLYSTCAWGACKQREGWVPIKCVGTHGGNSSPATLLQVLVRRYPMGVCIIWIPGGAHGDLGLLDADFCQTLKTYLRARMIYFRFRGEQEDNPADCKVLEEKGWRRPRRRLNSGASIVVDLTQPEEIMMDGLSGNWRHNLKRSLKRNVEVEHWINPNPEQVWDLYQSMQSYKGLDGLHTQSKIENILGTLKDNMVFYRSMADGKCVSVRACVCVGRRAIDFLAATNPEGRTTYASYGVLWRLLLHCKTVGIESYDLNGVDPEGNKGVFNFKLGTGGRSIRYLGEWERAVPQWLSHVVNWKIAKANL